MLFVETKLKGAFIIDPERLEDERGFFARSWCEQEFKSHGIEGRCVQCNISFNKKKGTLRGMHYQTAPYEEAKLVRCTKGAIHDLIVDIRPDSPTFKEYVGLQLTADNRRLLYAPGGFAHGFLTLEDDSEVFYQMSEFYSPDHLRGLRWDDPAFGIKWPSDVQVISDRDRCYPDFNFQRHGPER